MAFITFNTNDSGSTVKDSLNTNFGLSAPLASPTFTGTVTLPTGQVLPTNTTAVTQSAGNASTKVATTAYVDTAVSTSSVPQSYNNYYLCTTEAAVITFASDVQGAYYQDIGSGTIIRFHGVGLPIQNRTITTDWAAADAANGGVLLGSYLYIGMYDGATTAFRVYRYDKTNLSGGGTLMTTSGQSFGTNASGYSTTRMMIDASGNFYFTNQANNSASQHIISKYTVSGTVFTFVSNTTCGSTSSNFERFLWVDGSGNFYGWNYSVDSLPKKYNSSGTLVTTYENVYGDCNSCLAGNVYVRKSGQAGETYSKINL